MWRPPATRGTLAVAEVIPMGAAVRRVLRPERHSSNRGWPGVGHRTGQPQFWGVPYALPFLVAPTHPIFISGPGLNRQLKARRGET